jgi:WD40 repeat protein
LLSASNDGTLRVWGDLTTRPQEYPKLRITLPNPAGAVALSPDGQLLAMSVPTGVRLSDVRSLRQRMPAQPRGIPLDLAMRPSALAFSPDNKFLAALVPQAVQVWELGTDEPRRLPELKKSQGLGNALAFGADGPTLAAAGAFSPGNRIPIFRWDMSKETPEELPALDGQNEIRTLAFGPNGWLASAGNDGIRLWDGAGMSRKEPLQVFKRGHMSAVNNLAFAGNSATLLSVSSDTTVRQWLVTAKESNEVPAPLTGPVGSLAALAVTPDGKTVAVALDTEQSIRLWEPLTGKLTTLAAPNAWTHALAANPDGVTFAFGGQSGGRLLAALASAGKPAEELPAVLARVTALCFSPDGKILGAGFADGSVRSCNLTARPRAWHEHGRHIEGVRALAFSPNGKTLASAGDFSPREKTPLHLWHAGTSGGTAVDHAGSLRALAYSPDGKTLATAGFAAGSAELTLWDLGTTPPKPKPVNLSKPSSTPLLSGVAFLPDGSALLTSGSDGQVVLHAVPSGNSMASWKFSSPILALVVTADGRYLATANASGTVCLARVPNPAS